MMHRCKRHVEKERTLATLLQKADRLTRDQVRDMALLIHVSIVTMPVPFIWPPLVAVIPGAGASTECTVGTIESKPPRPPLRR